MGLVQRATTGMGAGVDAPKFQNDGLWWCHACKTWVAPEHVAFQTEHSTCGRSVVSIESLYRKQDE